MSVSRHRSHATLIPALTGLLALSLSAGASAEPHPMTVEDLWSMQRVGVPALSPDGTQIVFAVSEYSMEENTGNSDLWLVPADGSQAPRRLTWNRESDSAPLWRPDGKAILFLSKRDEGPSQLYLLPLDGGEAEPVTDLPFTPTAPVWFPDGKRVAFLGSTWADLNDDFEAVKKRRDELKESKAPVHATESRLVRYWDHWLADGSVQHLFVLDLEIRKVTDLMPGSTRLLPFWSSGGTFALSPDGKEIAFSANVTEPPYTKLNFDIFLMPSIGGEARNITADNPAFDTDPSYSPDGKYLVYGRNRRPEISPDFTRLARYDRRTGEIAGLAEEWDGQPGDWTFSPDGRTLYFHAGERGRANIFKVPVAGGAVERVFEGGTTGGVKVARDGRLVFAMQSIDAPSELMTIPKGAREATPITSFNAARLDSIAFGEAESVTFTGADGAEVQMWVVLPPGFDPSKKWPLLVLVHGGPHGAWNDSFHYRWNAALFAAPGYVTIGVNFHGSTGFGQAFAESILGNHAEKPFADIMAAVDYMVARGYIDESRMAAAGGSYGGYQVSWILGHTDRFACLVNHAGVYDLMGQFASDWAWGRANNYGATPWTDPDRIDLYSPSRYAAAFKTPTLILHGEKDYRVPYTQALNLHGVLSGTGVPSRLVVFPNENHWILKPQSAKVWWGEVHGWLERYIGAGASK